MIKSKKQQNRLLPLIYSSLFVFAGLSACTSQRPVPVNRYYHLPAPAKPAEKRKAVLKALVINRPEAYGIYNERAILYTSKSRPREVNRYHYHLWARVPALLVQESFITYFRESGLAGKVFSSDQTNHADGVININLLRFEQVVTDHGSRALVRVEISYRRGSQERTRTYEAQTPAPNQSIYAVTTALGSSLDKILHRFVKDNF